MKHLEEYDNYINEEISLKGVGEKIFFIVLAALVGFLAKGAILWAVGKIKGMNNKREADELLNKISKTNPEIVPILKTIQKMNASDEKRFDEIIKKLNADPMLNFLFIKIGNETDNFKKRDIVKKIEERIKAKLNSDELELWQELSSTM